MWKDLEEEMNRWSLETGDCGDDRIQESETGIRNDADLDLRRGRHLSYQRGKRNTNPGTSLIKIEGVDDTAAAKYVPPSLEKSLES